MAKVGRPTKYDEKYCKQLIAMFDIDATREVYETYTYKDGTTKEVSRLEPAELPTITDFAKKIGVNKDTLYEWAKKHKEFSDSLKKAKEMQENIWQKNSLMGLYNSTFAIFMGKNCYGWKDRQEIENKHEFKNSPADELLKSIDELKEKKQ